MKRGKDSFFSKFIFYWLPALVWAGVIFYLSNQPGLKVGFSAPNEILVRKIAHIAEFGILGWLVWRILYFIFELRVLPALFFSFLIACVYAISDEVHQTFVANRSGKAIDTFLDFLGILLFLFIVVQIYVGRVIKSLLVGFVVVLVAAAILVGFMIERAKEVVAQQEKQSESLALETIESKKQNLERNISSGVNKETENFDGRGETSNNVQDSQKEEDGKKVVEDFLPQEILLNVPFSSQAPFAVWDDVHEEACEETSLIMVKYFLDGKKLTPQLVENEIQGLKEYQLANFGSYHDSTMQELVEIARDYYGIENLQVIYDFEKDDLKRELAKGNPIIVPTAGRELGNPNFTQPGPLYHNLVLRGYDGQTIITNDPGTRKGESYKYQLSVLFFAIHDFPGDKERILEGRKAMIVIR